MSKWKEMAERTEIIRVPCGSTIHGLHLEGKDDRDEMGVCIEDIGAAMGFSEFEQHIFRSAAEREQKHDAPSQPGDLDLTIYSLRKFLRLAMDGNPTILNLLFVPMGKWVKGDSRGQHLQDLAPQIVSRKAGGRYLGYLESQRQRLLGERGQKRVNRPELEEKFGYDTKYAMHMLRLGYQGVELLSTGRITFPMPEGPRKYTRAVRQGEIPLSDVLSKVGSLEREIKDLLDTSPLSPIPNLGVVEEWMLDTYLMTWKCRDFKNNRSVTKEELMTKFEKLNRIQEGSPSISQGKADGSGKDVSE